MSDMKLEQVAITSSGNRNDKKSKKCLLWRSRRTSTLI